MDKLRNFFKNKYAAAGVVLFAWLLLWGAVFFVGAILENILLFILLYNLVYPVATLFGCYAFAKKNGIVVFMPTAMITAAICFFAFTGLIRYAMPNVIVITLVTVFFGTGIGNVMHTNSGEK